MNYEDLVFSEKLAQQRIAQAENILGKKVVQKIIAFALFLLGVNRKLIALFLNIPQGSIKSLILAINRHGLVSFEDQRSKKSTFKPPISKTAEPKIEFDKSYLQVNFNIANLFIRIPNSNFLQKRVILLSLLNNGLLEKNDVAKALKVSADRSGKLSKILEKEDVKSVIDQRKGQIQDYRFTPEVKGQLIEQFVIEAVSNRPTGGDRLTKIMKERCQLDLSVGGINSHLFKLGLPNIKDSLYEYFVDSKKKY
jgi:hypothetical protein